MALPSLISSLAQFLQPLPRGVLVLEPLKGPECLVEGVLAPRELVGGLSHAGLDRDASPNSGQQFLDSLDDGPLGDRGADRYSPRAVADRRASVDRVAAVVGAADDHPGAAGTAAENAEPRAQGFWLRGAAARDPE